MIGLIATFLFLPALANSKPEYESKALIFCLHDVDGRGKYSLTSSELNRVLSILSSKFTLISLKDWFEIIKRHERHSYKIAILTFDDGYHSLRDKVIPLLKKYRAGATFFVYPDRHRDSSDFYTFLRQLPDEIEIGSHSMSHSDLDYVKDYSEPELRKFFKETYVSKRKLEYLVKKPVISFAWPYGSYSIPLVNQAKYAGYSIQVSTDYKVASSTKVKSILPRFTLSQPDPVGQLQGILRDFTPQ